ncbi:MAG TPA: NRDE family protein [Ferruginibacter sp.]|jgi:hypothetical protein|nr:NRDE family protein [Ferruginibacter sp.]
MCTVSFVRLKDAVIITSNRDENILRKNAAAPAFLESKNKKIIFPRDPQAGGTWFAANENGIVAVLLNGAFKKHISKPPYRKSRGLVLLELVEAHDPLTHFSQLELRDIEPFTVILFQQEQLHVLRWDGVDKHMQEQDALADHLWSSSTLYTAEIIQKRLELFERFTKSTEKATPQLIRDFHGDDHGDPENGFVMRRPDGVKTFSITQAIVSTGSIDLLHHDLLQQQQFEERLLIVENIAAQR